MTIAPPPSLDLFEDWAEDILQASATGTGITINPPRRDRKGWDFIAEWDVALDACLPADRQKLGRTARIQVKSSRQPKPTARLKLSNALRFAEAVEPCFVVVYWLNRSKSGVEIYARHFDQDLISRTLLRAREADRDGETEHHKICLMVPMSETDLHTEDLLDWVANQCEASPAEYAKTKSAFFDEVGYDKRVMVSHFKVSHANVNALIEHAVGLNPTFKPEWMDLRDARFGIVAGTPLFEGVPDDFNLVVSGIKAKFVATADNGDEVSFPGRTRYFPSQRFQLGGSLIGSFVSQYVDARVYEHGRMKVNYRFKAEQPDDVRSLSDALRFFNMLDQGDVSAKIVAAHATLDLGMLKSDQKNDRSGFFSWGQVMLEELSRLPKARVTIRLSLRDLIDSASGLVQFMNCITVGEATLRIEPSSPEFEDAQISGLLGFAAVEIGENSFAALYVQPFVSMKKVGQELVVKFGNPVHLHHWAQRTPFEQLLTSVKRRFGQRLKQSAPGTIYADNGDMMTGTRAVSTISIT